MAELTTLLITVSLVFMVALFIIFLVLSILLFLMYKEVKKLRDTQDVIFNAAINSEEFFKDEGFSFSAN